MQSNVRMVQSCKAIVMRSEVKTAFEQMLEVFSVSSGKLSEIVRAAAKEFANYADNPEFNGLALVFKAMIIDGILTIRSTPILSAYKNNLPPAGWSTFYTEQLR